MIITITKEDLDPLRDETGKAHPYVVTCPKCYGIAFSVDLKGSKCWCNMCQHTWSEI